MEDTKIIQFYVSPITLILSSANGEGDNLCELLLKPGLIALVGENGCGKTAEIDTLQFA